MEPLRCCCYSNLLLWCFVRCILLLPPPPPLAHLLPLFKGWASYRIQHKSLDIIRTCPCQDSHGDFFSCYKLNVKLSCRQASQIQKPSVHRITEHNVSLLRFIPEGVLNPIKSHIPTTSSLHYNKSMPCSPFSSPSSILSIHFPLMQHYLLTCFSLLTAGDSQWPCDTYGIQTRY